MFERQYTRIDYVRKYVDEMLKNCADQETSRNGYVHLYGVGQACALIALHRGYDRKYAELAEIAGMLHDFAKYKENVEEEHAEKSSVEARQILLSINQFTNDEMQHWLRNPVEEYFFNKARTQNIAKEFGLI